MSIGRWVDKEVVVHIYNGLLLKCKKEHIWVSSNEVDETAACYTEWSKSERETPIQYINSYIWNLKRWQWWSYMQGRKRDTDVKNRLLDYVGEGEGGMIWENSTEICIFSSVQFSRSVVSNSLWLHESQHARPPCPSPTPVYITICKIDDQCKFDAWNRILKASALG